MKKYLEENIKNLPFILVAFIMFYSITTLATNYLFNSNEVSYDNTETGLHADEVQGAIDEVFQHATDYSELKNKIGTNTLTTTSQNLIGAVNEVNDQIVSKVSDLTVTGGNGVTITNTNIYQVGKIVVGSVSYNDTSGKQQYALLCSFSKPFLKMHIIGNYNSSFDLSGVLYSDANTANVYAFKYVSPAQGYHFNFVGILK